MGNKSSKTKSNTNTAIVTNSDQNKLPAILFNGNSYCKERFFEDYNEEKYNKFVSDIFAKGLQIKIRRANQFENIENIHLTNEEKERILLSHVKRSFLIYGITLNQANALNRKYNMSWRTTSICCDWCKDPGLLHHSHILQFS